MAAAAQIAGIPARRAMGVSRAPTRAIPGDGHTSAVIIAITIPRTKKETLGFLTILAAGSINVRSVPISAICFDIITMMPIPRISDWNSLKENNRARASVSRASARFPPEATSPDRMVNTRQGTTTSLRIAMAAITKITPII